MFYPTEIPTNDTKNKRVRSCKICAQNGCPGIPIRWKKCDGKLIQFEYDYPDERHFQHNAEDERLDWEFEYIRGR